MMRKGFTINNGLVSTVMARISLPFQRSRGAERYIKIKKSMIYPDSCFCNIGVDVSRNFLPEFHLADHLLFLNNLSKIGPDITILHRLHL